MAVDEILEGLQSRMKANMKEAKSILANPSSTGDAVAKAQALSDERKTLKEKIGARQIEVKELEDHRSRFETDNKWASEPQRRIPFSGAPAQPGAEIGNRIGAGLSEAEKLERMGGFKNLGHFAWSIAKMGRGGSSADPDAAMSLKRWNDTQFKLHQKDLELKTPSGMYEGSDPDGGDLIPMEFSNQIYTRMVAKNQILQYLNPIPIAGNQLSIPALLENSRADGSRGGGILGYWTGEANQYTSSKSRLRTVELKLHKLTVMTFITDELLGDSQGTIQRFLLDKAPLEINFKINDALVNGNGNGMPLGILKSNSLITASAVSGQGAGTVVWTNIPNMWQRLVAGQRSTALWLYNQDVENQLSLLYMPTGTAAGIAIFKPNENGDGGYKLYNRPALVMEQCATLGTAGDLICWSPEGYACITKGSIESFMSMHLRFDYDEMCYKWRFRFDAQPYDDVALTPYKGSNTVSSMVVLNSTRT